MDLQNVPVTSVYITKPLFVTLTKGKRLTMKHDYSPIKYNEQDLYYFMLHINMQERAKAGRTTQKNSFRAIHDKRIVK